MENDFRDFVRRCRFLFGAAATVLVLAGGAARAQTTAPLAGWDFTQSANGGGTQGWAATHDVAPLRRTEAGLVVTRTGPDPYLVGPVRDLPPGRPLWLRVRLKSDQSGTAQVFYFDKGATEANSIRFSVQGGDEWQNIRVPLPPLGPGFRLRLDPPGQDTGIITLAVLALEPRVLLQAPAAWLAPADLEPGGSLLSITAGDLQLTHAPKQWGGFALSVAGQKMAVGHTRPLVGYLSGGRLRWLPVAARARVNVTREAATGALVARATFRDDDGADWEMRQQFTPNVAGGAINVETRVRVSRPRSVVYLPLLVVLPGAGRSGFGTAKNQALLPGVEYLDAPDASSSEADVIGPGARRQVTDALNVTFPLMAVQAKNRYVGLIWEKQKNVSALFDSPDRIFKSGGHALGLLFPGANGSEDRAPGSLLPYDGTTITPNAPLVLRATLIGGKGDSVVPAVRQYVALRGLPPIPKIEKNDALALLASGWLDSHVRQSGDVFRHAYPGNFDAHPAGDAAVFQDWLAAKTTDAATARRLTQTARTTLAAVPPAERNASGVSHIRPPAAALVYGEVEANAERARQAARGLLGRFEADGSVRYRKTADRPDFGRTHFFPDANGLTAQVVASLLENAAVCGDPVLLAEGLKRLRALDKFTNTVPRGAQTWEVPLHTPDVLASAYLVRAYTLGYELSGDTRLLDQARYWAWTGLPFVYLADPGTRPVGVYASIAVLGATNWEAPLWIGLPVQWCGLVYADALYRLVRWDATGPWKQIADGITASGIQQTWPVGSDAARQGLLPDSFALRPQIRNDAAINPGTLQACAVRLLEPGAQLYDFRAFRANGVLVHAPGAIIGAREEGGRLAFTVNGWPRGPYEILLAGLTTKPRGVRVNGVEAAANTFRYVAEKGWLIVRLSGTASIEVALR